VRYPRSQPVLALIGTIALHACARQSAVSAPSPALDGFVHPVVRGDMRPSPAVLPDFFPTEVVERPQLRIECTPYPPPGMGMPDEGERPNWDGVFGQIDEAGQLIAWLQTIVDLAKSDKPKDDGPRYVLRIDDVRNGSTVHAIPLPSLPGMLPPGKCKTWRASNAATEHRRAIEQADKTLSRYVFRRLHSGRDEEKEGGIQMGLDLLRKRRDPAGDWTRSPPKRDLSMQDEGPYPAGFLTVVMTPPRPGLGAYVVALRCAGSVLLDLECVGPERAVVFLEKGQVLLSQDLGEQNVDAPCSGTYDWIHGVSPRRGLAVFGRARGLWASMGRDGDPACHGLRQSDTFRVLRFVP
jgi:hypothetical protein